MSKIMPMFVTAPRLKIYVGNNLVGYAVGFNLNISVDVQPVYVVGQYAPVSLEPTMYNVVTGTMQIVRLAKTDRSVGSNTSLNSTTVTPTQTLFDGNSEITSTVAAAAGGVTNTPLAQGALHQHVDPSKILLSQAFDVKIYMKVPKADGTELEEKEWFRIETCRVTSRNTNITMGQIVNEPMSFQGLLATPAAQTGDTAVSEFTLDGAIKDGGAVS